MESLRLRMDSLGVKEADLEENFTRSSGHGGQNVNKVSTAVRLVHKPTGAEVKCTVYRTQGLNRYKARAILCDKIESLQSKSSVDQVSTRDKKISQLQKAKSDKRRKALKKREHESLD